MLAGAAAAPKAPPAGGPKPVPASPPGAELPEEAPPSAPKAKAVPELLPELADVVPRLPNSPPELLPELAGAAPRLPNNPPEDAPLALPELALLDAAVPKENIPLAVAAAEVELPELPAPALLAPKMPPPALAPAVVPVPLLVPKIEVGAAPVAPRILEPVAAPGAALKTVSPRAWRHGSGASRGRKISLLLARRPAVPPSTPEAGFKAARLRRFAGGSQDSPVMKMETGRWHSSGTGRGLFREPTESLVGGTGTESLATESLPCSA